VFGLGAIKGVGEAALQAILEARQEGPFKDIFDLTSRVDLAKVNRSVIESLIKAGAFDTTVEGLGVNRGQVFGVLDTALERGRAAQRDRESGQTSLFGLFGATKEGKTSSRAVDMEIHFQPADAWDELTTLSNEKKAIGFYMSGHPMTRYAKEAAMLTNCTTETISKLQPRDSVSIAGMVMDYSEKVTKTGKRLALFALEDLVGRVEVVVYSDALMQHGEALKSDKPVFVSGNLRLDNRGDDERRSIILQEAMSLSDVRIKRTREVHLHLDAADFSSEAIGELKATLERYPGRCDAFLKVVQKGQSVTTLALPEQFRVNPSDELLEIIDGMSGITTVELR
jgi:DNA polymerase-3 subunit alpha